MADNKKKRKKKGILPMMKRGSAKSESARKKKQDKPSLFMRGLKWLTVAGLWAFIALGLLTAWYASELPDILDQPHFERTSAINIVSHDGTPLARYGELKGVSIGIEEIPNHLIYAVLAVEDRRFYEHFGVDPAGIARAMARNISKGRVVQGGSTITQQLAKNLFLSHARTLKRKIQEALLALWIERQFTKDEILTAYLNRVYLGAGAYGVDAASQTYFNKSSKDLSLYESAMLAGLLKAPSRYSPQSNPSLAARRTKTVLSAMTDAGYITEEEARTQSLRGQAALPKPAIGQGERYFTDWVIGDLDEMIGATDLNLTIETTLDADIQKAAEEIFSEALRQNADKKVTQGALIVMARDGAILAMVGGMDFRKSQFNRATQAQRPPGSAFKPFVYLAALENGSRTYDDIQDVPIEEGEYRPQNFDGEYYGEIELEEALAWSRNTAAVRLMMATGIGNVIDVARKLGIEAELNRDLSLALGSSGVPLIEMVTAYTGIANEGVPVEPYAITRISDNEDNLLYFRTPPGKAKRAVSSYAAGELKDMLELVIEEGTGRRAQLGFDAAGKTGTSQDFRDAWFIGFTDKYVTGVWIGNDDNSPMDNVTGGSIPADIWRDVMLTAHKTNRAKSIFAPVAKESSEFFRVLQGVFNN